MACGVTQEILPQKMLTNAQHDLLGQIGEAALKIGYLYAWMTRIPVSPTLDQTRDRHAHYKNELDKLVTKARRARIAGDLIERRVQAGYVTGESDFRCGRDVDTNI